VAASRHFAAVPLDDAITFSESGGALAAPAMHGTQMARLPLRRPAILPGCFGLPVPPGSTHGEARHPEGPDSRAPHAEVFFEVPDALCRTRSRPRPADRAAEPAARARQ